MSWKPVISPLTALPSRSPPAHPALNFLVLGQTSSHRRAITSALLADVSSLRNASRSLLGPAQGGGSEPRLIRRLWERPAFRSGPTQRGRAAAAPRGARAPSLFPTNRGGGGGEGKGGLKGPHRLPGSEVRKGTAMKKEKTRELAEWLRLAAGGAQKVRISLLSPPTPPPPRRAPDRGSPRPASRLLPGPAHRL